MRIPCPYCGERGNEEFSYLGAAPVARPDPAQPDAAFFDYVYLRDNPAGPHRELWYHAGCQSWLVATRDTRTHRIEGVALARTARAPSAGDQA